jgi:hypothetical protein
MLIDFLNFQSSLPILHPQCNRRREGKKEDMNKPWTLISLSSEKHGKESTTTTETVFRNPYVEIP